MTNLNKNDIGKPEEEFRARFPWVDRDDYDWKKGDTPTYEVWNWIEQALLKAKEEGREEERLKIYDVVGGAEDVNDVMKYLRHYEGGKK